MPRILTVNRRDITDIAPTEQPEAPLGAGAARLAVEGFALTANNVTYAASGEAIGYWRFYPSPVEGRGIVPVWGTARVVASRAEALAEGTRLYGFLPMAERFDIHPRAAGGSIVDAAPHRAELPPIYNRYHPLSTTPSDEDDWRAVLQPLLATSWLLADWLEEEGWFGAEQVIIGSASSKTGLGLGLFVKARAGAPRVVGLTSARNLGFVQATGACDEVLSYDRIEDIPLRPSVYVDMAGDTGVKRRLHAHLGDALRHSSAVGMSHWDRFEPRADLPGPKPVFFFAPARAEKRRADWGAAELDARITAGWRQVAQAARGWMRLERHPGLDAAQPVWRALATGAADPATAHVIRLAG